MKKTNKILARSPSELVRSEEWEMSILKGSTALNCPERAQQGHPEWHSSTCTLWECPCLLAGAKTHCKCWLWSSPLVIYWILSQRQMERAVVLISFGIEWVQNAHYLIGTGAPSWSVSALYETIFSQKIHQTIKYPSRKTTDFADEESPQRVSNLATQSHHLH